MALGTPTVAASGVVTGSATSSISSPTDGDLYLIFVATLFSGAESGNVLSFSGLGGTWQGISDGSLDENAQVATDRQVVVFWATDCDTTGTITISSSGTSISAWVYAVVHQSGTFGANPIVEIQKVENRTQSSVSIGANGSGTLSDTGDRVFACLQTQYNKSITGDAQFSSLYNAGGSDVYDLVVEYDADGSETDATYSWGGFSPHGGILVSIEEGATLTRTQDGYRFYDDDDAVGSETALDDEDTNISIATETPFRIRIQTDMSGDAPAEAMTLQYKEVGDGTDEWRDVPT